MGFSVSDGRRSVQEFGRSIVSAVRIYVACGESVPDHRTREGGTSEPSLRTMVRERIEDRPEVPHPGPIRSVPTGVWQACAFPRHQVYLGVWLSLSSPSSRFAAWRCAALRHTRQSIGGYEIGFSSAGHVAVDDARFAVGGDLWQLGKDEATRRRSKRDWSR